MASKAQASKASEPGLAGDDEHYADMGEMQADNATEPSQAGAVQAPQVPHFSTGKYGVEAAMDVGGHTFAVAMRQTVQGGWHTYVWQRDTSGAWHEVGGDSELPYMATIAGGMGAAMSFISRLTDIK